MSFGPFSDPFFSGTVSSSDSESGDSLSSLMPVSLAGQGFVIDLKEYDRQTVEITRQQADQSDEPGEQSFNPQGLWRRSQESWHEGAGQDFLDAKESSRFRFRLSKGLDPWTRGKLKLLPDTENKRSSAETQQHVLGVGSHLYLAQGAALRYTTDPSGPTPTWTTVTGTPAGAITSMVTNGSKIWISHGTDIYVTGVGDAAATAFSTDNYDFVGYANGRLLGAVANELFELDAAGTSTSIFEHPNTAFRWSVISSGQHCIYVGGNAGEQGEIYRIELAEGTTGLGAPVSAAAWPDGEQVYSIVSYIGGVIIGTSRGVRLGSPEADGSLSYGAVIRTTSPVRCLEPQDQFVWYGWSNYDGLSSGLGRLDLSTFTDTLIPAWASDLMATAQGTVSSVTTFAGKRYFTVSGVGCFGENLNKVASGSIDLGEMRFGTTERKVAVGLDIRYSPLLGIITSYASYDGQGFEEITSDQTSGATGPESVHSLRYELCERLEIRLVLTRDAGDATGGPEVVRWTSKVQVAPARSEEILVPILLYSKIETGGGAGSYLSQDVSALWEFLKDLERDGRPILYQEGVKAWLVTISKVRLKPTSWLDDNEWLNGTAFVLLQTVE